MPPEPYAFPPVDQVQCPRCGGTSEIRLTSRSTHDLEYAGICETPATSGAPCGTVLRLMVVAHSFPLER